MAEKELLVIVVADGIHLYKGNIVEMTNPWLRNSDSSHCVDLQASRDSLGLAVQPTLSRYVLHDLTIVTSLLRNDA